jgi:hypothetical protein
MSLSNCIQINYQPVYSRFVTLDSNEWTRMVKLFIDKLAEKPIGKMLSDKLLAYIARGYSITIQNHDFPDNRTVFPKIKYIGKNKVLIVIPSVPYFTTIDTVESGLCEDVPDKFFSNLSDAILHKPVKYKLTFDNHSFLLSRGKQTGFISLAHELIHCLRKWEGMNTDDLEEEDNTIYGIIGSVLSYNDEQTKIYITENTIRKEWGMSPRVTHDCKETFCMYVPSTHSNSEKFTKHSFYECV